jgi:transcriptional regulator with XRE-family HTH domain
MDNDSTKQLGQFVQQQRHQQGLSLRTVARRAGVSKTWLFNLENGTTVMPSLALLRRLARGLDLDESALLEAAGHLPGVRPYLRAKFDLSEPAAEQVEDFLRWVQEREQKGGDDDRPQHHRPAA